MNTNYRRLCSLLLPGVLGLIVGCSSEPPTPPQDPALFKKEVEKQQKNREAERKNQAPQ
jgi:hypothetical protein